MKGNKWKVPDVVKYNITSNKILKIKRDKKGYIKRITIQNQDGIIKKYQL